MRCNNCYVPSNMLFSNVYIREVIKEEIISVSETLKGDSAYEVAVKLGYTGNEEEWLTEQGATIEQINVNTGEAGTEASVILNGTPKNRIIDLTIPKGDTGIQGIQGEKGDKGDKGLDGRDGSYVQKAYKTYAGMIADKDSIPIDTNVVVNNDPDKSNNAFYTYDGTEFTKSDFDPQGILTTVDVRLNQAVESASDYFQSQVADTIDTAIDNSTVAYTNAINTTKAQVVADAKAATESALDTAVTDLFENGGLPATPFKTKALMTASVLVDDDYAYVTDDSVTDNNGLYVKTAGTWVKSSYDPMVLANNYTDDKVKGVTYNFTTKALMVSSSLPDDSYAMVIEDTEANNGLYVKTAGAWIKSEYDPLTQAKAYSDSSKVANSDITTQYINGNMIGSKTSRLTNIGISNLRVLSTSTIYASVVLDVSADDVLFIHNTLNDFVAGNGSIYAFFAENPATNTTQTRIAHTTETIVDSASSIKYQKVIVPADAKYLLLNTKYASNNYEWAVHQDKFSVSYETGTDEIVVAVKGNQLKGSDDLKKSIDYVEGRLLNYNEVKISTKNLFNPDEVITGSTYNNIGGVQYNPAYRRTIKYPCTEGEWIAISGLIAVSTVQPAMHFWDSQENYLSGKGYPVVATTTAFTIQAPDNAAFFSLNLNDSNIPPKLQIEKSPVVTAYEPYRIPFIATMPNYADVFSLKTSSKNLYDGRLNTKVRMLNIGSQNTGSEDDVVSSFIPVQLGETYTISGINPTLLRSGNRQILGFKDNTDSMLSSRSNFTAVVGYASSRSVTITITDEETKYIALPLTSQGFGTLEQAKSLSLQVEEGSFATPYEPYQYSDENLKLYNASVNFTKTVISAVRSKSVGSFTEMDIGRRADSNVVKFEKGLAPTGIRYSVTTDLDSGTNNLYAKATGVEAGTRVISANLMKLVGGTTTLPSLKGYPFTVPSGQLDNPDTLATYANNLMNKYNYCHPDIAYDSTGVAGFKYWMVSSILPPYNMSDTQWEDEDVFVSNDAITWQRVRSLYETDKTYTTAELRLPPHNLEQTNARRYGLLPCPASGDTIEISVPADNGAAALERVNITLTGLPWKHDPAILIDGGYVYIYHSYHLPYVDRDGGKNRFIVCTRTSNGIDWDVVRSDGSTMRITAENSRTIFTKNEEGKYNYLYYAYSRGYSNPTVIKYGANDYELIYGENYSFRIKGTTPYNFDFSEQHPLKGVGSGNHPMVFYDGVAKTYIINNNDMFESTDRGVSFTKLAHYPAWVGGIAGYGYKKSLCIGEGGKVILVDTQRYALSSIAPNVQGISTTLSDNMMFIYEYPSLTDFINKANNGLVDAYVDFQLCKVNAVTDTRVFKVFNAVGIKNTTTNPNAPLQKIDIVSMDFEDGDELHIYATLTSRNGATVRLGGIDIK